MRVLSIDPEEQISWPPSDPNDQRRTDPEFDGDSYNGGHIVRRGSEGYEIRPVDREEILRRYILSRGSEAGRYKRYVPEPDSESDSGLGNWDDGEGDDDIPVDTAMDQWRTLLTIRHPVYRLDH